MKKLFMVPLLALVMGLAWTAVSTPDASARDYNRYDRHDRHDRWDRDRDHRGSKWNRGHGKVHKWTPPGHRVKRHVRHRGHDHDRYDRRYIRHRDYDRHDYRRYRHDRHHDHESNNFSLSVVLPILDAFASSGSYRY